MQYGVPRAPCLVLNRRRRSTLLSTDHIWFSRVTSDPDGLVADTIAALERMPAAQRAISAAGFIAAVLGVDDRRITRIRWAAIAELHDGGLTTAEIADQLGISVSAVDLALQAHGVTRSRRYRNDAPRADPR
jgi:hypothetical protein